MNTPKERFTLTTSEINSALWQKISKHLDELLQSARKKNDVIQDIDSTNVLRGEIRCIKKLSALSEPIISVGNQAAANRSEHE